MQPQILRSFLVLGIGMSPHTHHLTLHDTMIRTAKVWKAYRLVYELTGHTQSVWAVLALEADQYLTGMSAICQETLFVIMCPGSADKTIKLWRQQKCLRTYHGHKDAVRSLALISDIGFASASNDRLVDLIEYCSPTNSNSSISVVKFLYGRLRATLSTPCPPTRHLCTALQFCQAET